MKTALIVPSKQAAKSTANQSMMTQNMNKDPWIRGAVMILLICLLYYLWGLVHDGAQEDNEAGLNEAYTVYTCVILILVGMGVLWR
jgi:hypothetical protein